MNQPIEAEWALEAAPEMIEEWKREAEHARDHYKPHARIQFYLSQAREWTDRYAAFSAARARLDRLCAPLWDASTGQGFAAVVRQRGEGFGEIIFADRSSLTLSHTDGTVRVSCLPGEEMARLAAPALAEWLGLDFTP